MGFGLPAAIGAKVARPDALVIDVDGDASFSMTLTELSTAAQFNIGVKIIIRKQARTPIFSTVTEAFGSQQRRTRHGDPMAISILRGPVCAHASKEPRFRQAQRGYGRASTEVHRSGRCRGETQMAHRKRWTSSIRSGRR